VYRAACKCPHDWRVGVKGALPDHAEFLRLARNFEKLALSHPDRARGFSRYAPHVLKVDKNGHAEFPPVWGHHKEVIAGMSHWKCVYCEGLIGGNRSGHVEHFKPKAVFPTLAYAWTNYFLGCADCNGSKGTKWPRSGYLRPDRGDPSRHFLFAEDGTVKAARPGRIAAQMLVDFDLTRKPLCDHRELMIREMLRGVEDAKKFYSKGNKTVAKVLGATAWRNVSDARQAYSVALTQCFLRAWKKSCPGVKV
jgi:uncharacterized protein (TIGR02646 family)